MQYVNRSITSRIIQSKKDYDLLQSNGLLTHYDVEETMKNHNTLFGISWKVDHVKQNKNNDYMVTMTSTDTSITLPTKNLVDKDGKLTRSKILPIINDKSYSIVKANINDSDEDEKMFFDKCNVQGKYFLHPDVKSPDHDFSNDEISKIEIVPVLTFSFYDVCHIIDIFKNTCSIIFNYNIDDDDFFDNIVSKNNDDDYDNLS